MIPASIRVKPDLLFHSVNNISVLLQCPDILCRLHKADLIMTIVSQGSEMAYRPHVSESRP